MRSSGIGSGLCRRVEGQDQDKERFHGGDNH